MTSPLLLDGRDSSTDLIEFARDLVRIQSFTGHEACSPFIGPVCSTRL